MRTRIPCGAIVPGCDYVAHGEEEAEAVRRLAAHAASAHGIDRLSDNLQAKVRSAVEAEEPTRTQA